MTAQVLVNKIENHFYDLTKHGQTITRIAVFFRLICQILF